MTIWCFCIGGSCVPSVSCRNTDNCSLCAEEAISLEIEYSLQCPRFETVAVDGDTINLMGSKYCICESKERISLTGTNQCGETAVVNATCEAGIMPMLSIIVISNNSLCF